MDCRSYYVNLKSEDFKFVKPEIKKPTQRDIAYEEKLKEIREKILLLKEEEERRCCEVEYYLDYDDGGGSEEVQSERLREKELYKPLESEIDEWLQAVEALSSRVVVYSGRLFGHLDPVPFIDEVDPAFGACFNCQQPGHPSKECPEPRTEFCVNCGRRGESVVDCPRCSRNQREFFARRREEERRRATSACRESSTRAASRERPIGRRSRSVGRPEIKAAGLPGGRDIRAEVPATTNTGARYRDRRDGVGAAEKPILAQNFSGELRGGFSWRDSTPARYEGPRDHRAAKEPNEICASDRPRRRRVRKRRRPRRRDRREYPPQGNNPALLEPSEEERRQKNKASAPADNSFVAARARRERPIGTAVECRREVVAARTETRRAEESQQTAEDHVANGAQRAAEESWREYEKNFLISFFKEEKRNEPKKRSEEEKIFINLEDAYKKLLKRMNRQLSAQFCKLIESMQLSEPEVIHIWILLKEIEHYDTLKQELIIMDELILNSYKKTLRWKTEVSEDIKMKS